ncbi:uncharacterized protein J3D65DRAFT_229197 [Phyllosticta citribraziliensis]|uniref:Uncharacterized protein n=1 Tax=Phyllosticta citribraziliensis TaxID=989973 RepID=A0ABR1M924_9PEZI
MLHHPYQTLDSTRAPPFVLQSPLPSTASSRRLETRRRAGLEARRKLPVPRPLFASPPTTTREPIKPLHLASFSRASIESICMPRNELSPTLNQQTTVCASIAQPEQTQPNATSLPHPSPTRRVRHERTSEHANQWTGPPCAACNPAAQAGSSISSSSFQTANNALLFVLSSLLPARARARVARRSNALMRCAPPHLHVCPDTRGRNATQRNAMQRQFLSAVLLRPTGHGPLGSERSRAQQRPACRCVGFAREANGAAGSRRVNVGRNGMPADDRPLRHRGSVRSVYQGFPRQTVGMGLWMALMCDARGDSGPGAARTDGDMAKWHDQWAFRARLAADGTRRWPCRGRRREACPCRFPAILCTHLSFLSRFSRSGPCLLRLSFVPVGLAAAAFPASVFASWLCRAGADRHDKAMEQMWRWERMSEKKECRFLAVRSSR